VWKVDAYLKYGITGTDEGEAVQWMMSPRQWEFRVSECFLCVIFSKFCIPICDYILVLKRLNVCRQ